MTDKCTIIKILTMLMFGYPGRDPLTEIAKTAGSSSEADDLRDSLIAFWLGELQDLDEGTLLAATRDLCCSPGQWPPSVGDVRQRAVELSLGHLAPPSVGEAWRRVCEWAYGENVQLTDAEHTAAKRSGGSWELKHSTSPSTTRAHFIRFYEEEIKKIVARRRAHPETRQLADANSPPVNKFGWPVQRENEEPTPATKEEIRGYLSGLTGFRMEEP